MIPVVDLLSVLECSQIRIQVLTKLIEVFFFSICLNFTKKIPNWHKDKALLCPFLSHEECSLGDGYPELRDNLQDNQIQDMGTDGEASI